MKKKILNQAAKIFAIAGSRLAFMLAGALLVLIGYTVNAAVNSGQQLTANMWNNDLPVMIKDWVRGHCKITIKYADCADNNFRTNPDYPNANCGYTYGSISANGSCVGDGQHGDAYAGCSSNDGLYMKFSGDMNKDDAMWFKFECN